MITEDWENFSIQPKNGTAGNFNYLDFKGNDGVVGLSTMMRMSPIEQLCKW